MREQELREMDRAASVKRKKKELRSIMDDEQSSTRLASAEPSQESDRREERQLVIEQEVALNVPNTVIRDGQIQIDEDSLRIDRHAAAAVAREIEEITPIDENDLSRRITSASFQKRDYNGGWNEELLDRFYEGLRMFGTDFEMISRMFPGKSRQAIKKKFVKEERFDYARIKATLLGEKLPVILEEYEKSTGVDYEDPAKLAEIMEEDRKQLQEEHDAEVEALAAVEKEREAQAAAEHAAAEDLSSRENDVKGRHKKSKKDRGKQRQRKLRRNAT